jgi:hypothetical protein
LADAGDLKSPVPETVHMGSMPIPCIDWVDYLTQLRVEGRARQTLEGKYIKLLGLPPSQLIFLIPSMLRA